MIRQDRNTQKRGWVRGNERCLSATVLNAGKATTVRQTAITDENELSRIASPINCLISADLCAPITFRIPTSLALLADRAVERFMKFTQAINKINTATMVKSLTYSLRPPSNCPFLKD